MLKIACRFGIGIAEVSQRWEKHGVLSPNLRQGPLASLAKFGPLGNLFELGALACVLFI